MQITATSIYKRYHQAWIIRDFNYTFHSGSIYGIAGWNGSGKTTLLQILAGLIPPSKGKISYESESKLIAEEQWYRQICYAAPYADLYDYMSLDELVKQHLHLRTFINGLDAKEFISRVLLKGQENKLIKHFSSGMKQRLKLGLSILTECKVLFLDEPQSNLDEQGKIWYRELLNENKKNRIIIIASNEADDFAIANNCLRLESLNQ